VPDRPALAEHLALFLQQVALDAARALLAAHGLGARLQHVEPAVVAVARPLDVHRTAVVLLDAQRDMTELSHLLVGNAEPSLQLLGHRLGHRGRTDRGFGGVDHADLLVAEVAPQDRRLALAQAVLEDVELVGVDGALHHGLAETVGRGDEHGAIEARLGVQREHHAARAGLAAHHALHPGRQRDLAMVEALVHAIGDRAIVEQRGEHLVNRLDHALEAADVEEGLLLPGEGGIGQILGGRGGTHGDRDILARAEACIGFAHRIRSAAGSGVARIQPRISAPARASSATSSTSRAARRAAMRAASPSWPGTRDTRRRWWQSRRARARRRARGR
jgi:hypothetical protein